ncbi:hypothetical protein H0H81_001177 [Sphagnurus paluster]|uniref:RWD domain-containing protein n=1 Tax=Sphagnurus paluster TaxID=117069 RepID=A0A9P7KJ21_9AGAR|nr:hypothetical protein H0H81_001177 [Sphagnurus paluster]
MSSEAVLEELEVLESIYPEELSKISEREIEIDAEPDDPIDGAEEQLSLRAVDGEIDDDELEAILEELRSVGNDNIGMAMTFTLVSHLREQLSLLVRTRTDRREKEEREKERLALEEEEARTRGTPVTVESFKAWKAAFDKEVALKKARDDEEKLKVLTPKEREEWKRVGSRLSGRQLFERADRNLEDETLLEEGTVSVDITQYERTTIEEEEEEEGVTFSDSD